MDINDYVFINKKVLKFVGLYPTSIVRYIVCCMCMITIVIPQGIQIYENWEDLSTVLETSSVLLTILLAILKSLVWISNRRKMDPFIRYMLTDYWDLMTTCISEKHADVYTVYVKKGYLYTKGYLFLICNSLMFFFSLPMIEIFVALIKGPNDNSTRHFPFLALYPESYYNFPMYEIIFLSQVVATSLCGLVILGTDTLIATALFHTCGHFKVLQRKIKNIDTEINVQHGCIAENMQKIKLHVIDIIKYHYTILWFCDYMETVFSPMLFLQTLASSLIICLSSMVYKTVYAIAWYKLPILLKTEIHLLILRSQKPSKITAGKFYVMHLENFTGVRNHYFLHYKMCKKIMKFLIPNIYVYKRYFNSNIFRC
ncbi:odorant receptor 82a-like isoform X3 [Temnothorax curvispinosus]|uniref:Odorant receptor n=1 Tax=Temnothorax curvispinosus TaxID=300111 RepID=A0A6J1PWH8_9HYME|nr:odorant receptor 82a-like isoform X3 [Temnothorax curvispinosus]